MPRASVWLIRTALLQLLAGSVMGALMLAGKDVPALAWAAALRPAHQECMLAGWLLQLVFGVAFSILPRQPGRAREEGTGAMVSAYVLLNGGVVTASLGGLGARPVAMASGRAAVLAAALLVAAVLWPRIRRYGLGAAAAGISGPEAH